MRQRPNLKTEHGSATWHSKLHPFFIHATEYCKEIAILSASASPKDRAKAEKLKRVLPKELSKEADQVNNRSKLLAGVIGLDPDNLPPAYSDTPLDVAIRERFAFFKYRKSCRQLQNEKNWKALGEIDGLMWKARFFPDEVDNWTTKTNRDHYVIMAAGIGFGLENLSKVELEECFNALCPCGLSYHSGESLRQLRSKLLRKANQRLSHL